MAKMEQALTLDPPAELHFKAPFTDVTTSYLKLGNPTDKEICFKVKTTAPKTYCVRPNSGFVPAKHTTVVAVMLQPLDLENCDKSRHKFMVQSIFAPDGEYNLESLWRDTPPEGFMNSKLKCVFDLPSEKPQAVEDVEPIRIEAKTVQVQESSRETPPKDSDAALQKLHNTHKRLQNELNELRQENSSLKEECLRSRVAYDTRSRGTSVKPAETNLQVATKPQLQLSNSFMAIAVIIFLLGIYVGNYIL